jgi:hypothetical protein
MNKTMKRLLILAIIVGSVVYSQFEAHQSGKEKTFSTSYDTVELTFPPGWFKNPEEHPFDLQCLSKDQTMNTGVFQFNRMDLEDDLSPKELLKLQVDDIKSRRENFKLVQEENTICDSNMSLTTVVYSGDLEASKYYYRFTYIEFDDEPDTYLVILQICSPSNWKKYAPVFDKITRSTRIKKNGEPEA